MTLANYEYINSNGAATECQVDKYPDSAKNYHTCKSRTIACTAYEKFNTDGTCTDCSTVGTYYFPEATKKRTCVDKSCNTESERPKYRVLNNSGTCELCGSK